MQSRVNVPLSELTERLLDDLKKRWPYASMASIAAQALHRGLVEMRDIPSIASGAPQVEWRRVG